MNAMLRVACRDHSAALVLVNSAPLGHENSGPLSNQRMKEVEQVRRERLQSLRERFGSLAELNRELARPDRDATLGQYLNMTIGTKSPKVKAMGSALAREIEEKLSLPRGWMDTDPDLVRERGDPWPFKSLDYARFDRLTLEQKIEIQGVLRDRIDRFEADSSGGSGAGSDGLDPLQNAA